MATQTVTVSRTPVPSPRDAASRSVGTTGTPAASAAIDYSLTDLDLLDAPLAASGQADAPAEDLAAAPARTEQSTDAAGKGTENAPEAGTGKNAGEDSADKKSLAEFDRAFELPEIGPKLREICERESSYREVFPTVAEARAVREVFPNGEAARAAAAAQADLARLDRLVESRDPRAHAELLAGLQRLAPEAFRDLAITFGERLAVLDPVAFQQVSAAIAAQAAGQRSPAVAGWPEHVALLSRAVEQQDWPAVKFLTATLSSNVAQVSPGTTPSFVGASRSGGIVPLQAPVAPQADTRSVGAATAANQFLETVNTSVEQAVQSSVAGKVAELLPDAPEGARQKIAGEIFRELDQTLRQDPELLEQVRESVRGVLRSGPAARNFGTGREPADRVAQLIAARARAALPGVAKRVVADWTETVLRSSQARRSRQSESASRVEVGRGGAPAPVPLKPRGVDYARMTDEEILNME